MTAKTSPFRRCQVSLPQSDIDLARSLAYGNLSAGLRELAAHYRRSQAYNRPKFAKLKAAGE